ncbi:MAG: hypothetical protein ACD_9C00132G0001 [uncultured bacterium]|nr:MAG: hypothetical protein ACD_9C00132G0001 [uncultured bacterium]
MLCSPNAHFIASEALDFPEPLGPTIAVIPLSPFLSPVFKAGKNSNVVLLAKDLNPDISTFFRYTALVYKVYKVYKTYKAKCKQNPSSGLYELFNPMNFITSLLYMTFLF